MKRALYLASSCGLAYVLSMSSVAGVAALARMHAASSVDEVMRWYGIVLLAVLAGVAFVAAVMLTPRRSSGRS